MTVNPSFENLVVDQLTKVVPAVRSRRMFGGVGIYSAQAFFALIADDTLYFKVDDTNQSEYEARGMGPFRPYGEGTAGMRYFQVPEEVLEDTDVLREWAERAISVARQAKRKSSRRKNAR